VETVNASGSEVASYADGPNVDEPLAMDRSGTIDYYEQDGLDSVTSLTASNGSLAQSYTYDSFGDQTASSGSSTNFFRYTGREFDTETGLYFNRARYFDPSIGRFLNDDPLRFRGGIDFYAYVWNNSVNWRDAFGLQGGGAVGAPPVGVNPPEPTSGEVNQVIQQIENQLAGGGGEAGTAGTAAGEGAAEGGEAGGPVGALIGLNIGLAIYDIQQGVKLYHSYFPPSPSGKGSCKSNVDCKQVKEDCIDSCLDKLGKNPMDQGAPFRKCIRECMEAAGCSY
jgi:RHS repeat-associated protein